MDRVDRVRVNQASAGDTYVEVRDGLSVNTTSLRLITYHRDNEDQATIQIITLHNDVWRQLFDRI